MKGLLFSDIHFKLNSSCQPLNRIVAGTSITLELKRAIDSVDFMKELVKKYARELDFVAFLGDLFHSLNKNYNIIFYYAFQKMQELYQLCRDCGLNFVVVAGNHDYVSENKFLTDLLPNDNLKLEKQGIKVVNYTQEFSPEFYKLQADYILTHNEFKNLKFNKQIVSKEGYSSKLIKQVKYSILNGHYHMHQKFQNIICVGSVYPQIPSEQSDFHGAIIFDFDKNEIYKKIQNDKVFWFKELRQEDYDIIDYKDRYILILHFNPSRDYIEFLQEEGILYQISPKIQRFTQAKRNKQDDVEYIIENNSDTRQFIELLKNQYPKFSTLFDKYLNI